ncbi:MAG: hypothetical protein IKQ94_11075 [Bacteroidales bacterium]|nr:hypothetical protein [Bacteroidales bacterium]
METKNDNRDVMELLEKAWNEKEGKIVVILPEQDKKIRQLIRSGRNTQCDRLFRNKAIMLVFCGIVLFYLFAHYTLYIYELKYLLPFAGLTLFFGASVAYYARVLHLILNIGSTKSTSRQVALGAAKLLRYEKKELIYSLSVALPLLIVCTPPITSITFNRLDFYQNITAYLPAMAVATVLSIIGGIVYYRRNVVLINKMSDFEKVVNVEY